MIVNSRTTLPGLDRVEGSGRINNSQGVSVAKHNDEII